MIKTTLVDLPLEVFPYVAEIGYNDRYYITCTVDIPLSRLLKRLCGAVRGISKYQSLLDEYMPFYTHEFSGAPTFRSFSDIDRYIVTNHIYIPPRVQTYISISQTGKEGNYEPPELKPGEKHESIREWISSLPVKGLTRYPDNQTTLVTCEGIFQAVRGFVTCSFPRIPLRIKRFMNNKLPKIIFENPLKALDLAKEFAHHCDRSYFNISHDLKDSPFRVFEPFMDSKRYAWGRYIQRSLPHGIAPTINEYVERVSVVNEPDPKYLEDFGSYVGSLPLDGPFRSPCFRPTNKGSIETTRSSGGQSSFYDYLIKYELIRLRVIDRKEWSKADNNAYLSPLVRTLVRGRPLRCLWNDCYPDRCLQHSWDFKNPENGMASSDWSNGHARFLLLVAACWNMIKLFPRNPIQILVLKERGGKYRIPTKSLVPVQVLGGIIRSRVNEILMRDPRIRASLTDEDYKVIKYQYDTFIRSQDLSFATDNYSYSVMKEFYNKLLEKGVFKDIPFTKDYLEWIYPEQGRDIVIPETVCRSFKFNFGYRYTVTDKYWLDLYESKPLYKRHLKGILLPQITQYRSVFKDSYDEGEKRFYKKRISEFEEGYVKFIKTEFKVVGTQRRGPCMGEPLSWPILPIVSCYGFDRTHPPSFEMVTCGDDSAFRTTLERNRNYDKYITALGATVNKNKDSIHKTRYIFTERLFDDGVAAGVMPFAPAFALPSLKQEQTYYTLGPSLNALASVHQVSFTDLMRIYRNTRFRKEIVLYNENCVNATLPHMLGGLSIVDPSLKINWTRYRLISRYIRGLDNKCPIRGNRLSWSRKLLQPTRINEYVAEDLLRFVSNEEVPSKWTFNKAWLVKSQNIYALGSLTGSMPLDSGSKRPSIFNRKYALKSLLSTVQPTAPRHITIDKLVELTERKFNPPLVGFEPSFDDSTCVGLIDNYEKLPEKGCYEIIFSPTFERAIKCFSADGQEV